MNNVFTEIENLLKASPKDDCPFWIVSSADPEGRPFCFLTSLIRSCCSGGVLAEARMEGYTASVEVPSILVLVVVRATSGPSGTRTGNYKLQGHPLPLKHTGLNKLDPRWRRAAARYWKWREEHPEVTEPEIICKVLPPYMVAARQRREAKKQAERLEREQFRAAAREQETADVN